MAEQPEVPHILKGGLENYQLICEVQQCLYGSVHKGVALTTGTIVAIKIFSKEQIAERQKELDLPETPLAEVFFAPLTASARDHLTTPREVFHDPHFHYVVSDFAPGEDLLELLKLFPDGMPEPQARFYIRQATEALFECHRRGFAMQDFSLENCLLFRKKADTDEGAIANGNGNGKGDSSIGDKENEQNKKEVPEYFSVKVCDPGQAILFKRDSRGRELPVPYRGCIGKKFRPPEAFTQSPYLATKVDCWDLGWAAYYLLFARQIIGSCDERDEDWRFELFKEATPESLGDLMERNELAKDWTDESMDFILRLMSLRPQDRMSVEDALKHPWLHPSKAAPVPYFCLRPAHPLEDSLVQKAKAAAAVVNRDAVRKIVNRIKEGPLIPEAYRREFMEQLCLWHKPSGHTFLQLEGLAENIRLPGPDDDLDDSSRGNGGAMDGSDGGMFYAILPENIPTETDRLSRAQWSSQFNPPKIPHSVDGLKLSFPLQPPVVDPAPLPPDHLQDNNHAQSTNVPADSHPPTEPPKLPLAPNPPHNFHQPPFHPPPHVGTQTYPQQPPMRMQHPPLHLHANGHAHQNHGIPPFAPPQAVTVFRGGDLPESHQQGPRAGAQSGSGSGSRHFPYHNHAHPHQHRPAHAPAVGQGSRLSAPPAVANGVPAEQTGPAAAASAAAAPAKQVKTQQGKDSKASTSSSGGARARPSLPSSSSVSAQGGKQKATGTKGKEKEKGGAGTVRDSEGGARKKPKAVETVEGGTVPRVPIGVSTLPPTEAANGPSPSPSRQPAGAPHHAPLSANPVQVQSSAVIPQQFPHYTPPPGAVHHRTTLMPGGGRPASVHPHPGPPTFIPIHHMQAFRASTPAPHPTATQTVHSFVPGAPSAMPTVRAAATDHGLATPGPAAASAAAGSGGRPLPAGDRAAPLPAGGPRPLLQLGNKNPSTFSIGRAGGEQAQKKGRDAAAPAAPPAAVAKKAPARNVAAAATKKPPPTKGGVPELGGTKADSSHPPLRAGSLHYSSIGRVPQQSQTHHGPVGGVPQQSQTHHGPVGGSAAPPTQTAVAAVLSTEAAGGAAAAQASAAAAAVALSSPLPGGQVSSSLPKVSEAQTTLTSRVRPKPKTAKAKAKQVPSISVKKEKERPATTLSKPAPKVSSTSSMAKRKPTRQQTEEEGAKETAHIPDAGPSSAVRTRAEAPKLKERPAAASVPPAPRMSTPATLQQKKQPTSPRAETAAAAVPSVAHPAPSYGSAGAVQAHAATAVLVAPSGPVSSRATSVIPSSVRDTPNAPPSGHPASLALYYRVPPQMSSTPMRGPHPGVLLNAPMQTMRVSTQRQSATPQTTERIPPMQAPESSRPPLPSPMPAAAPAVLLSDLQQPGGPPQHGYWAQRPSLPPVPSLVATAGAIAEGSRENSVRSLSPMPPAAAVPRVPSTEGEVRARVRPPPSATPARAVPIQRTQGVRMQGPPAGFPPAFSPPSDAHLLHPQPSVQRQRPQQQPAQGQPLQSAYPYAHPCLPILSPTPRLFYPQIQAQGQEAAMQQHLQQAPQILMAPGWPPPRASSTFGRPQQQQQQQQQQTPQQNPPNFAVAAPPQQLTMQTGPQQGELPGRNMTAGNAQGRVTSPSPPPAVWVRGQTEHAAGGPPRLHALAAPIPQMVMQPQNMQAGGGLHGGVPVQIRMQMVQQPPQPAGGLFVFR